MVFYEYLVSGHFGYLTALFLIPDERTPENTHKAATFVLAANPSGPHAVANKAPGTQLTVRKQDFPGEVTSGLVLGDKNTKRSS